MEDVQSQTSRSVEGMSKAKQVDLASEGIAAAAFQKHGVECFTNPPQQMTNAFLLFLFVSFLFLKK